MTRRSASPTSCPPRALREVRRVYYEDRRDESAVRCRPWQAVEDDAGPFPPCEFAARLCNICANPQYCPIARPLTLL